MKTTLRVKNLQLKIDLEKVVIYQYDDFYNEIVGSSNKLMFQFLYKMWRGVSTYSNTGRNKDFTDDFGKIIYEGILNFKPEKMTIVDYINSYLCEGISVKLNKPGCDVEVDEKTRKEFEDFRLSSNK